MTHIQYMVTGISDGFLIRKVILPHAALAILVGDCHPAKSCQASFGPSSVFKGNLSSAMTPTTDRRVEHRTMLH
jgi:hypothetical protein